MELEKHTPFHHPGHRELEKHRTLAVTREGKKLDGRHTGCIKCDKVMFCALGHRLHFVVKRECFAQIGIWNKISSMQKGISKVEIWIPRDMETS